MSLTTEDFIRKAETRHAGFYDYSRSVYQGAHTPLTIVCPVHGAFSQRAADHTNGKGCPACGVLRGTPAALTQQDFVKKAVAVHGEFYDYTKAEYKTSKQPLTILCPDHGEFEQTAGKHLRGSGCPRCRKGKVTRLFKAKTTEERADEWKRKASELHGGYYDYSKVRFVNTRTPVEIMCPKHGAFFQAPGNHLNGACKCPACAAGDKAVVQRKSHTDWVAGFILAHPDNQYDYSRLDPITSCLQRVTIGCPAHGDFLQQAYVHMQGFGCPKCGNKVSTPEVELREWIRELLPEEEILSPTRAVIPPYELDIYIPGRKLALEFNGTYWHSEHRKSKMYHQMKSLMCRERGILLLHIHEHDWLLRKEACKRLILGKLQLNSRVLNARDLTVRPVERCADFLKANHFLGDLPSALSYGLFEGEGMVAVMTFGKPRFSKSHKWELLRFCSLCGTRIRGAAGKLFKRFIRDNLQPGESVISYAKLDYSAGGVYTSVGFTFDGVCLPDYVWVKQPGTVLSRHMTQKHKLSKLLGSGFSADVSEADNMRAAGYKRIYSAGNLRYVYRHAGA